MTGDHDAARILLTGGGGQLASYLVQQLPAESTVALPRAQLDVTDAEAVDRAFAEHAPAVVINTAAYNHVDQGESEFARAFRVNAEGPLNLARACAAAGAKLVHVSTDYVFGGQSAREPLSEVALPAPLSVYGASKLAGEHLVRTTGVRHLIVRTCGLYGSRGSAVKGGNFVRTMLRLAREGRDLRVVNDQHCTPSYARDVAEGIVDLIEADAQGAYHVVNEGVLHLVRVRPGDLRRRRPRTLADAGHDGRIPHAGPASAVFGAGHWAHGRRARSSAAGLARRRPRLLG